MREPLNVGQGVDAAGDPVVDPTANVIALSEAAARRQDDLRMAAVARLEVEIADIKELFRDLLASYDKRYEQRYEASQRALEAAFVAQKDAINAAFGAQKEAINAALAAADRAVSKAEASAEKRFEGVNEFRAQLGDQQRTLMPRTEAENRLSTLGEKVGVLEAFRTEMLSKGNGMQAGWAMAVGVAGVVLTILSIISVGIVVLTRFARP